MQFYFNKVKKPKNHALVNNPNRAYIQMSHYFECTVLCCGIQ